MESLPEAVIFRALTFLTAADLATIAYLSRELNAIFSVESLWSYLLLRDFNPHKSAQVQNLEWSGFGVGQVYRSWIIPV